MATSILFFIASAKEIWSRRAALLITLLIGLSSVAMAREIPRASDYDLDPSEVFTESQSRPWNSEISTSNPYTQPIAIPMNNILEALHSYDYSLYGHFYPNQDPKPFETQWDASSALEWQDLQSLNQSAQELWLRMQRCHGSDAKIRQAYVSGSLCREVREDFRQFRISIAGFLASTMAGPMRTDRLLKCFDISSHQQIECTDLNSISKYNKPKVALGYTKGEKTTATFESIFGLMDSLPAQVYHPLLIQVLLENLASGYPMNYGGYWHVALIPTRRAVITSDDMHLTFRGNESNHEADVQRANYYKWVTALLGDGDLPKMQPGELSDPKLQLLRQGIVAGRILSQFSAGTMNCSGWGLWPARSLELLGDISQSSYSVFDNLHPSKDLDILAMRLSRSCDIPIANSMIMPGATGTDTVELAKIGAWRSLLKQYEE